MRSIHHTLAFSLIALFAVLCMFDSASSLQADQKEVNQPSPRGGLITWDDAPPAAGSPVKLSVRSDALAASLLPNAQMQLFAAGNPIFSDLMLPDTPSRQGSKTELPIISRSSPASEECWVVIDLSEFSMQFDRLDLKLATAEFLGLAEVLLSRDGVNYGSRGGEAVVYQRMSAGQLVALTTVKYEPTDLPFLKVSILDAEPGLITTVSGWQTLQDPPKQYAVPAALGSMQGPDQAGQYLWPLILPGSSIPLAQLTIHGQPQNEPMPIAIVRLDENLRLTTRVSTETLVEYLVSGGGSMEHNQFRLPISAANLTSTGNTDNGWGIAIQGETSEGPLRLTSVEAQAAEVWLAFVMPDTPELELWFDHPSSQLAQETEVQFPTEQFLAVGLVDQLNLELAMPINPSEPEPAWRPIYVRWRKPAIYAFAACLAIAVGVALLRKQGAQ